MLLREASSDRLLGAYSVLIIDEAHERSLQSDVALAILKAAQAARAALETDATRQSDAARGSLKAVKASKATKTTNTANATKSAKAGGGASAVWAAEAVEAAGEEAEGEKREDAEVEEEEEEEGEEEETEAVEESAGAAGSEGGSHAEKKTKTEAGGGATKPKTDDQTPLAVSRRRARKLPPLKIIVMSATLEVDRFCDFFGGAPAVQVRYIVCKYTYIYTYIYNNQITSPPSAYLPPRPKSETMSKSLPRSGLPVSSSRVTMPVTRPSTGPAN